MRVLITTDIFPPDVGGPATYVPVIAAELVQRGHVVRVLTYSQVANHNGDATYPFEIERIVLHGSRALRLLRTFSRIAANMRQADVVYVNGLLIETALVNVLLRRPAIAKIVGDIAWERARDKGWISEEFEEFQQRRYGRRIELRRGLRNWAVRQMRGVITPSAYLKRVVIGWGIQAARVRVIYNAFEPTAGDATSITLPLKTRHRLITICRLTAWKGVDGLIEAISTIPDIGLVVVGDGPERSRLESLAQQVGVLDRVYFAGQVPKSQVNAYLRMCDLFVLNSRYEGLPHVILEAMAAGLPVIAAEAGGTSEVVQDGVNGRLVPALRANELRLAIQRILNDAELRSRFQHNAYETLDRFSPATMKARTLQCLTKMVD